MRRSKISPSAALCHYRHGVPYSSIGAGLAAAKNANIPVVTWEAASRRRSGYEWFWRPVAQPVLEKMVADLGGKGDLLCSPIEPAKSAATVRFSWIRSSLKARRSRLRRTKFAFRIFRRRRAIRQRLLASHPAGRQSRDLAAGRSGDRAIGSLRQQGRDDVKSTASTQCSGDREY